MRYSILIVVFSISLININITLAQTGVSFVEVMPNPDGTDTKTNEYIKFKNNSDQNISLEGNKVCNISNDCYVLKGEIGAGTCLKIFRTDFIFTLHNDKEQLILYDPVGSIISQVSTGSAPSDQAWLCSDSYCQWGDPRESCDYSDILDPASLPSPDENENENTNDNSKPPEKVENSNGNKNNNTNSSVLKPTKKTFQIFSKKDWSKVKREMSRKNLLSLVADAQGSILIPLNIVKANTFYISASNILVAVNIYSSRQADLNQLSKLYNPGTWVQISQGYLKNSSGNWQLGIGKSTKLKIMGKSPISEKNETVKVSGKILRKSGQYFYIENQNNATTVFIPAVIWNKYLEKEKIGSFPQLVNKKIITASNIKGKNIQISGIIETSGDTKRIIVISENDIQMEKNNIESSEPTKIEEKPAEKKIEPKSTPNSIKTPDEIPQNPPAEKQSLGQILSQKLSWVHLWTITLAKIKGWGSNLF